ncbi:unnamed protein product [Heligmosomoides polygyrus]|uniref:Activin_recp domain-containing protein n=1 Tax=Heligmosomoides polygyrus TaxID=6339 RepID=A0A183G8F8_HELPZ|nr:unnamed protein product [Heligmosomoides polygyrus]
MSAKRLNSIDSDSTIGNNTKLCGKDSDSCYNATADVASFSTIRKAGCNTLICQFNQNQCVQKNITGIPVTFCCCKDADLCNRGVKEATDSLIDKGASVLKGIVDYLG